MGPQPEIDGDASIATFQRNDNITPGIMIGQRAGKNTPASLWAL